LVDCVGPCGMIFNPTL